MTDRHAVARAEAATTAPAGTPSSLSCTDRLAMEANANLVGQVHDYHGRLERAEQRAKAAEQERAKIADAPPTRLVPPRAEWARMAREGTIRVRVPCSRPDRGGRFLVRRAHRYGVGVSSSVRSVEVQGRTSAAGLSPEEIDALVEAYGRAHARTWAAMRASCEANESFREAMSSREEGEELTDQERVERCSGSILDIDDASTRAALGRVAELHAVGAGIERTTSDEQRVAFALTNAPAALYDEMVRALGREKAMRAIDNGVLCLDEALFDLHAPADEG